MPTWRDRFLLLYMMRVPLLFLLVLGVLLPLSFQSSMFHGVADLNLWQVLEASFLSFLLVSAAMTTSFLVLLYGQERADGWPEKPVAPELRVSAWSVVVLYLFGAACWISFLVSIFGFMKQAGRVAESGLLAGFLAASAGGLLAGLAVVMVAFILALRLGRPQDDEALEVFAFPAILVLRRLGGGGWVRALKNKKQPPVAPGSYAAHDGWLSRFVAARLGPGYGTKPSDGNPPALHSGFRFASWVVLIFLICYVYSGEITYWHLRSLDQWDPGGASNNVLNYLLMFLILWNCILAGITFFVDRFRIPALVALGFLLLVISFLGGSDHQFLTLNQTISSSSLPTPQQVFRQSPESVVVVAAAGGGIQSAAWTSKALCSLRTQLAPQHFQQSVLAVSGVSGGSVGALFYLRCLEPFPANDPPEIRARDSSLGAVAWGLTHPDLARAFIPFRQILWHDSDRGWALERSILKSANFANHWQRLAKLPAGWPVVLFGSTDALTGDPVVFTNSNFPAQGKSGAPRKHSLHNFFDQAGDTSRDVLLTTAARMSAAFPYVSPEASPEGFPNGVHLGDGGYFDNAGMYALSQWLEEAATTTDSSLAVQTAPVHHRILILQLDAFPDEVKADQQPEEKWYYQLFAPILTILHVRSEGQVVRNQAAGKDLQKILNAAGYDTGWMLIRYEPSVARSARSESGCPTDPPLSWHLTPVEQDCIDSGWNSVRARAGEEIARFLRGDLHFEGGRCEARDANRPLPAGMFERFCPAVSTGGLPPQTSPGSRASKPAPARQ